ncbi:hypothetical protein PG987_007276 [Apiospora arundinis]
MSWTYEKPLNPEHKQARHSAGTESIRAFRPRSGRQMSQSTSVIRQTGCNRGVGRGVYWKRQNESQSKARQFEDDFEEGYGVGEAAAIIGLSEFGLKSTASLWHLITALKNTPDDIAKIRKDIARIEVAISRFRSPSNQPHQVRPNPDTGVDQALSECDAAIHKLQSILSQWPVGEDIGLRSRFAFLRKRRIIEAAMSNTKQDSTDTVNAAMASIYHKRLHLPDQGCRQLVQASNSLVLAHKSSESAEATLPSHEEAREKVEDCIPDESEETKQEAVKLVLKFAEDILTKAENTEIGLSRDTKANAEVTFDGKVTVEKEAKGTKIGIW